MKAQFLDRPYNMDDFLSKLGKHVVYVKDGFMNQKRIDDNYNHTVFNFPTKKDEENKFTVTEYKKEITYLLEFLKDYITKFNNKRVVIDKIGLHGKGKFDLFDRVIRPVLWEEFYMDSRVIFLWG